jgi:hypothetical protein
MDIYPLRGDNTPARIKPRTGMGSVPLQSKHVQTYTPEARLQQVRSLDFFNQFALLQQSDSNK